MKDRDPITDDTDVSDDTIFTGPTSVGTTSKPTVGHRHFHDALHPGGIQGVKTTMDTEGSLGSQSGPQPSGGRTGMAEHVGAEDRSGQTSLTDELSGVEIGHFGEGGTGKQNGPKPSGVAPATPLRIVKR